MRFRPTPLPAIFAVAARASRLAVFGLFGLFGLALPSAALAADAHQHGVARLDVAVEAGRVSITLDTPLDNLLGFERAPRSDAERQAAAAVVAALRRADQLFRIDAAAACRTDKTELVSAALKLGPADGAAVAAGHADLEAQWQFVCTGAAPGHVDVGLFDAFQRLQRLDVQVAGVKGQSKATLTRTQRRVEFRR